MGEKTSGASAKEAKRQRREARVQRDAQERQSRTTRRRLLWGAGGTAASAATIAGAVVWAMQTREPSNQTPRLPATAIPTEVMTAARLRPLHVENQRKLNEIIPKLDTALSKLRETLTVKLTQTQPALRAALLAPLELYENNKQNPDRNQYDLLIRHLDEKGDDAIRNPPSISPDINHFFMQMVTSNTTAVAGYIPASKTFTIREGFDPANVVDVLVAYHEIEHARQDIEVRKTLTPETRAYYNEFHNPRPGAPTRTIGSFEQEAYLKQTLVLNTLLDGKLERDARSNTLNTAEYQRLLNARPTQMAEVKSILDVAQGVFQSGSTLGNYQPLFRNQINQSYQGRGREVYERTQDGRYQRLP